MSKIKITKVTAIVEFIVETESGGDYRRGADGGWEHRFDESWEMVDDDTEIEDAFLKYGKVD